MELSFQSLLLADRACADYAGKAPDEQHTDKDADRAPGPDHDLEREEHNELNESEDYWGTGQAGRKDAKGESERTGGQLCTRKSNSEEEGLTGRKGKEKRELLARKKEKETHGERHEDTGVERRTDEDERRHQDEKNLSKRGRTQVCNPSDEGLDEPHTEGGEEDELNESPRRNKARTRQRRPGEQAGHVSDSCGASSPLHSRLDRHRDAEHLYRTSEARLSRGQHSSGTERKPKRRDKRSEQGGNLVSPTRGFRRERRAERAARQFLTEQVADTLFSSFKFFTAAM